MMEQLYEKYGLEDDDDEGYGGEIIDDNDPINSSSVQDIIRKANRDSEAKLAAQARR